MAFILSNLLSTLDSSIGLLDSSSDLLEVLQALNVTNSTKGYGKSQKRTYDTVASLPTATSALRGFFATVETVGEMPWEASGNADNGLYVCNGSDWTLIQGLDSAGTPPLPFQGSTSGYTSGGFPSFNIIDKFPFATDANATDVGDLTTSRNSVGQSSENHGYCSGAGNIIDKFSFATDANATDVGDLLAAIDIIGAGQSSNGWGFGYHSGGRTSPGTSQNVIEKFAFATDANATDVSDLTAARHISTGQSSYDNGYVSAGAEGSPAILSNVIDKFPFATDANATDVGNLTVAREGPSGQSSSTHGYTCGGHQRYTRYSPDGIIATDTIDKFPFAADGNATSVGVLSGTRATYSAGTSSTANGYATAGATDQYGYVINHVDKFSFSSDANATDVLNLTATRTFAAGQQI